MASRDLTAQELHQKSLERQIRGFHQVRLLAELPGRLAGSAAEREAAERVEIFLRDVGFDEVAHSAVASRPRPGHIQALHLGAGALACGLGGVGGLALAALTAFSFSRESRGLPGLLTGRLPARDSVSVAARAGNPRPRRRVVLSAALDAPQPDGLTRLVRAAARAGAPRLRPRAVSAALLAAAVVVTATSALGADGFLVGAACWGLAGGLSLLAVAGLTGSAAAPTPGARRAAGVAALLACGEQLHARLPEDTELWLVGAGAGAVGGRGLQSLLEAHPEWRADTTCFVHFEDAGGEALHYVRSEGTRERLVHPPMLVELARRVAESGAFGEVTPVDLERDTGGAVAARRQLHALTLASTPDPSAGDDRPETLDMAGVVRAADFGNAVVTALLRGDADPLPIV
jgi:hypothetical protein